MSRTTRHRCRCYLLRFCRLTFLKRWAHKGLLNSHIRVLSSRLASSNADVPSDQGLTNLWRQRVLSWALVTLEECGRGLLWGLLLGSCRPARFAVRFGQSALDWRSDGMSTLKKNGTHRARVTYLVQRPSLLVEPRLLPCLASIILIIIGSFGLARSVRSHDDLMVLWV